VPGKKQTLKRIGLFAHLSPLDLALIDGQCTWMTVAGGSTVVHHGDRTHDVFFLVSGKARVLVYSTDGKLMPMRELAGGDFFGEMSAIDDQQRSASVEAVTTCHVARMTASNFRSLVGRDAELNRKLMLHFVQQIRGLTGQVYTLGTHDLSSRIGAEILRIAERDNGKTAGGSPVIEISNKTQFAQKMGATREAVSRAFTRLVTLGALEPAGAHGYRFNVERLRDIIEHKQSRHT